MRVRDLDGTYRDATVEEIAETKRIEPTEEIENCKAELAATDYKCMKHADGELTDAEYEPIRQHRHELRQRINELEALIAQ